MRSKNTDRKAREDLLAFALGLPGAFEDHPWGESVVKVAKKIFVFLGTGEPQDNGYGIGVKLPESGDMALMLPFVTPSGYGLGKSGWVNARFPKDGDIPIEMLKEWIVESYRAVAPKKLAASLGAGSAVPPPAKAKPAAKKKAPAKVAAKKKAPAKAAAKAKAPRR